MAEGDLLRSLMLAASAAGDRLFRNNVAKAWVGKLQSHRNGSVTLHNARPLHAGLCIGSSDLIGWTRVTITPEMVGTTVAVFTAVEAKTGRLGTTTEQGDFLKAVTDAGGIASVAREKMPRPGG